MRSLQTLAAQSNDADAIYEALQRFDRMTVPLAEAGITQALREETT
jgi:hypothetical protein